MKHDAVTVEISPACKPLKKWPILIGLVIVATMAVILFRTKPPFAPDVSVKLLGLTNTGSPDTFKLTRDAEYEIVNRSDGSVRLDGLSAEQRDYLTHRPSSFPERTARWSPMQPDVLRPGERRKIVLSINSPRQYASEVRGVCTVTPMSSWLHEWLRRQPWSKKLFRILRPPPPPPSYSFPSAWKETE